MKADELKEFLREKTIRWDMTPKSAREGIDGAKITSEEEFKRLEEKIEERVGVYFYIDVWDMKAELGAFENKKHGGTSRIIEDPDEIGITEDMLEKAVDDHGGAVNISGHYPINNKIKDRLKDWFRRGGGKK